ncbi:dynamin family protein [Actinomadura rugatobispora]|uniref:Dynamin family protein n=1 Tax=Actinomadura rugatobispora TaxID=1994 RepID=A0ABW1A6U6_9ACTN|nr:dynamin family protein [Actinomadura rugatobispora]
MNEDESRLASRLAPQVRALCQEVADAVMALGDPADRDATAAAIRAEAGRAETGAAGAIVVGEKKRGKSSLINALVGRPGLLPVEVDVATSVHLAVGYAPEPQAEAVLNGKPDPVPIGLHEIPAYAALDPESGAEVRDDVRHVRVGVPSPLLRAGLVLIDTPGVGGLVSGHARITLAALTGADALVFVVNGSVELTRSELTFLTRATERIGTVLFVLAQTDKYRGWREVLERNRALLAEHAPRYASAPWFPVSGRAELEAVAARESGDAAKAERLAASSGIGELSAALTERVASRAWQIRLDNALHLAAAQIEPLAAALERRVRSLEGDPELEREVVERRERLRELQGADAQWRRTLARRTRELERTLRLGFQRSVNDLRALAEEKIAKSGGSDLLSELPGDLEAGIEGVWLELQNGVRTGMRALAADIGREFADVDVEVSRELTLPDRLRELPRPGTTADDSRGPLAMIERVMPGWGAGALTIAALGAVTGSILLPVAAGFGLMALLSGRRKRREELRRARGDATKYVNRLVVELNTEIPPKISAAVEELSDRLGDAVSERIAAQRTRLEAELAAHQSDLRAAQETLARDRRQARAGLERLRGLGGRAEAMRRELGVR